MGYTRFRGVCIRDLLRVYVIFWVVPCDLLDIKGYVILIYSTNRNGYCIRDILGGCIRDFLRVYVIFGVFQRVMATIAIFRLELKTTCLKIAIDQHAGWSEA